MLPHVVKLTGYRYFKYFSELRLTVYIVAAAPDDDCITFLRSQLNVPSDKPEHADKMTSIATGHPLLLHSSISSIVVGQSYEAVHNVRTTLMTQISQVHHYVTSFDDRASSAGQKETEREGRARLTRITTEFHQVSQRADTGIANCEKAIENSEYILHEYRNLCDRFSHLPKDAVMESSMKYSLNIWECQKKLLVIYKARKETSMNLVFNLVTQQDSAVNVKIASKALEDSSSMKTIAALTMVFLPGTFVAVSLHTLHTIHDMCILI